MATKIAWLVWTVLLSVCVRGADFNVARFGAVGDGVTDTTKALQAAIDAAVRNGGGTVLVPASPAPYMVRDTLLIRGGNVEIVGPGATLKLADGAFNGKTKYMIFAEGSESAPLQRVTLRGLTIDANYFEQTASRHSKAVVFRFVEHALVEDVTITHPYVGLSFRRGANHAVARRVTVSDYQEDGFDAGGDADEVSGGEVHDVTFTDVVARDAPRCKHDGNAFEIEDGAQGVSVRNALVENVAGPGAGLRNHRAEGLDDHSRDIEFRNVVMRRTGGQYAILVRAAPAGSSRNTYEDVRLVDVTVEGPAAFLGPIAGLVVSGGSYGEILVGVPDPKEKAVAADAVPGATFRNVTAKEVRINGASESVVLEKVTAPVITIGSAK